MEVTSLGKKGQVSIPKAVFDGLKLTPETVLLVETTQDGAIVLRPATPDPVGLSSEDRVRELLEAEALSDEEHRRLAEALE